MKKIIIPLIVLIFLSSLTSCSRYVNAGGGGCGTWYPKKFERDKRVKGWVKSNAIRNGWNRHY